MSKKIVTTVMIVMALTVSAVIPLGTGCSLITDQSTTESDLDVALLEEVWDIIREEYVEPDKLDVETLIQGAVKGMVEALDDPYSVYMDPDDYELFTSDLAGEFEGIGAHVGERDGQITIIAPIPGTPADEAGLEPGDVIVGVDGESTVGWSVQDAVNVIRGPGGTPVRLLILREGDTELLEIEIIRAEIEVPSIYLEMRGDIAHIIIAQFTERTSEELSTALDVVANQEATGVILDLRNNPGGLLSAVVAVASRFLDEGIVVSVVDNKGNKTDSPVEDGGQVIELPIVVLVNEYSASGSEVLAGALQDYDRAVVAGDITFGKGSVNILRPLSGDSGLYITIARWYTPGGRLIEGEGIEPDFEIDPEEVDPVEWALDYLENHM
ncbi:MAG: PDZ domain-containing protein [Dehalococcoidales bacterium]|nr:MAG: PDZ domain-containing protein [Dehalococcoidales bacterium]